MNNIFKKVISAAIAVSTLGSIALPVYADGYSVIDDYHEFIKKGEEFTDAFQSLSDEEQNSDDVYVPRIAYGGSGCINDILVEKTRKVTNCEAAPNGRRYNAHAMVSIDRPGKILVGVNKDPCITMAKIILDDIANGTTKTIDGKSYYTYGDFDYEYYIDYTEVDMRGEKVYKIYMNAPEITTDNLGNIIKMNIEKYDSFSDIIQDYYDIYKEEQENGRFTLNFDAYHFYTSNLDFTKDINIRYKAKRDAADAVCNAFANFVVVRAEEAEYGEGNVPWFDKDIEEKQQYEQCSDDIKEIVDFYNPFEPSRCINLAQIAAGDVNIDGKIDLKDLALLKKVLIHEVELPSAKKMMISTNEDNDLDVRDLTNIVQYLTKFSDSVLS